MKRIIVILTAPVFLFTILLLSLWYIAIPEVFLEDILVNKAEERGLSLSLHDLSKGRPFKIKITAAEVGVKGKKILSLQKIELSTNPLRFLLKRMLIKMSASFASGFIDLEIVGNWESIVANCRLSKISVQEIDYLKVQGITGKGELYGNVSYTGKESLVNVLIQNAELKNLFVHNFFLPLELFDTIKGVAIIKRREITLSSVTFEGKNIFARIKGGINRGIAKLTIEIMPEPEFTKMDQLALLKQYEVSSGFYSIPVNKKIF